MFFFFPIGVDYRPRRFSWGCCLVIGVSVSIYILSAWADSFGQTLKGLLSIRPEFIAHYGFVPSDPTFGTFVLSFVLHANLFHIAANILYLTLFGPSVEDVLGPVGFILLYLVGAGVGTLVHWGFALSILPEAAGDPVVGASGAVSCLLGVFAVRFFFVKIRVLYFWWIVVAAKFDVVRVSAQAAIAIWMATEVGLGILSLFRPGARTGHWSHVFAFLVGLAIAQAAGMRLKAIRDSVYRLELARAARDPLRAAGESEAAVACVPADVEVQLQAARAWAELDDFEKATGHLEEAARIAIKCDDRRSLLEIHEAAERIAGGVKLPPAESFAIANALLAAGRFPEAVARLDTVWQDHEDASEARVALLRAAEIRAEKLKDVDKGKELLEQFCRKYPDSEWLGYVRGKLDSFAKRSRPDEAAQGA